MCSFFQFSSVQFQFKIKQSEKPIRAPPRLSEVSSMLPLKQCQCLSDWQWPCLVLWQLTVDRCLFPCRSLAGDLWWDPLGCVPLVALVMSQAPKHFRSSESCDGCFLSNPPVYPPRPDSRMSMAVDQLTGVFEWRWMSSIVPCVCARIRTYAR